MFLLSYYSSDLSSQNCLRFQISTVFEDEDDDIGGSLVKNKSDSIPKPTKDKYLEESINSLKSNSFETNKHVMDNLCCNERQALFRLKSDKSIVIKEADKGNAVVILD
jgi:hypothetical protein